MVEDALYPNRPDPGEDESDGRGGGDPDGRGGADGVSRRTLLAGSAAAGTAATAGCLGAGGGGNDPGGPTVFVFNTGDGTVSVLDAAADEVVATADLGASASFPANQFAPGLTTAPGDPLWLNVGRGVRAVDAGSLSELASFETGSGANWQELTPDGAHLLVSAREPTHANYRLDADPDSDAFGEVTGELDRTDEGGTGDRDGPGPCDVTVHPGGEYAYVPDIFGDTLTVLDVEAFEVVERVAVDPVGDGPARPWMATASWDGERLLVEHSEGDGGTESVWDVSDPASPQELVRLTGEDGLGTRPLTSEIGPDSAVGYVFTPGSEDLTLVDLEAGAVTGRLDLGGAAFVGTWGPAREKLYVPVQSNDEVAVVDHAAGEVATRVDVGPAPYGATAATVRPDVDAADGLLAAMARLGVGPGDAETTYCIGECACGHEL